MRLVAVVVVALPFLFSIDVATATTLGELTRRCERLESFWRMHPNPEGKVIFPNQGEPAFCFGYLEAIADLGQSIEGPNKCYQTQDGKIGVDAAQRLGSAFLKVPHSPKDWLYSSPMLVVTSPNGMKKHGPMS